jgi:hypothetical protein
MPAILWKLPTREDQHLCHIPKSHRGAHALYSDGMEWGTIMIFSCGVCDPTPGAVRQYEAFPIVQFEKHDQ